ncbi:MAG: lipA [Thermoleophilia bacterium]|nr:lipA [Thermoleophilia bacterium]
MTDTPQIPVELRSPEDAGNGSGEPAPRTEGARGVRILEKLQLDPVTQEPKIRRHAITVAERSATAASSTDGSQLAGRVVDLNDADGAPVDRGKLTREEKQAISDASLQAPKPPWLKIKLPGGGRFSETAAVVREHGLHTICEEGHCPNMGECWGKGTATFQILGDTCTRACRYCNVKTGIPGTEPDPLEPGKLAHAIEKMGITHAVITSVDRDELPDRGAGHFAHTITAVRRRTPETTIEVLVPDFIGQEAEGMRTVLEAGPDVYSHNVETVKRLYPRLRPKGSYDRAMWILENAKPLARELGREGVLVKTALIAGMGETMGELKETLVELRERGVDVVAIGQYLRPSTRHVPVDRYVTPEEFDELAEFGMSLGFGSVFAGPLVRSSYKAEEQRHATLDPTLGKMLSEPPRPSAEALATVGVVPEWKREDDEAVSE